MNKLTTRKLVLILALALLLVLSGPVTMAVNITDFTDVPEDYWGYDFIDDAVQRGLFVGTSSTTFEPETTMSRAMFVTVLSHLDGVSVDNSVSTRFADVESGTWYTGAVAWAANNGITSGTSSTTFSPNDPVTREQMATLIVHYAAVADVDLPEYFETVTFSDASSISSWAKDAVAVCQRAGIMVGVGENIFAPLDVSTRAQAATVFSHLCSIIEEKEPDIYSGDLEDLVTKIAAPVRGGVPESALTAASDAAYTVSSISWTGTDGTFTGGTVPVATIELVTKDGSMWGSYTSDAAKTQIANALADSWSVVGTSVTVSTSGDTMTVTLTFRETPSTDIIYVQSVRLPSATLDADASRYVRTIQAEDDPMGSYTSGTYYAVKTVINGLVGEIFVKTLTTASNMTVYGDVTYDADGFFTGGTELHALNSDLYMTGQELLGTKPASDGILEVGYYNGDGGNGSGYINWSTEENTTPTYLVYDDSTRLYRMGCGEVVNTIMQIGIDEIPLDHNDPVAFYAELVDGVWIAREIYINQIASTTRLSTPFIEVGGTVYQLTLVGGHGTESGVEKEIAVTPLTNVTAAATIKFYVRELDVTTSVSFSAGDPAGIPQSTSNGVGRNDEDTGTKYASYMATDYRETDVNIMVIDATNPSAERTAVGYTHTSTVDAATGDVIPEIPATFGAGSTVKWYTVTKTADNNNIVIESADVISETEYTGDNSLKLSGSVLENHLGELVTPVVYATSTGADAQNDQRVGATVYKVTTAFNSSGTGAEASLTNSGVLYARRTLADSGPTSSTVTVLTIAQIKGIGSATSVSATGGTVTGASSPLAVGDELMYAINTSDAASGVISINITAQTTLPDVGGDTDTMGFAVVITKDGEAYWEAGVDSVSELVAKNNLQGTDYEAVNILPSADSTLHYSDSLNGHPYLFPDSEWTITFVSGEPDWWSLAHENTVWQALCAWMGIVYDFDYWTLREPINSTNYSLMTTPQTPTENDILLLRDWVIMYNKYLNNNKSIESAIDTAGQSAVGVSLWQDGKENISEKYASNEITFSGEEISASIANAVSSLTGEQISLIEKSVTEALAAYTGSFYSNITAWADDPIRTLVLPEQGIYLDIYPYYGASELWKSGFIPSFDGETWRLSSGKDGQVVYTIPETELLSLEGEAVVFVEGADRDSGGGGSSGEVSTNKAFSVVIDLNGNAYWAIGSDTPESIISAENLTDDETNVKITILPEKTERFSLPYLYPDLVDWVLTVVDDEIPQWYLDAEEEMKAIAYTAWAQWKNEAYDIDGDGAFDFCTDLAPYIRFTNIAKINSPTMTTDDLDSETKELINEVLYGSSSGGGGSSRPLKTITGTTIEADIYANFEINWNSWLEKAGIGYVINTLLGGSETGLRNVGGTQTSQRNAYYAYLCGGSTSATIQLNALGFIVSSDGSTTRIHNLACPMTNGLAGIMAEYTKPDPDQAFAALVDEDGEVYWAAGTDSSVTIESEFASQLSGKNYVKINIIPEIERKTGFASINGHLYPDEAEWVLYFDATMSTTAPDWWKDEHTKAAYEALEEWKEIVYDFDLEGLLSAFSSMPEEPRPVTDLDKLLISYLILGGGDEPITSNGAARVGSSIYSAAASYIADENSHRHFYCPGPAVNRAWERYFYDGVRMNTAQETALGGTVDINGLRDLYFGVVSTRGLLLSRTYLVGNYEGTYVLVSGKQDKGINPTIVPEVMLVWNEQLAEDFLENNVTNELLAEYDELVARYLANAGSGE